MENILTGQKRFETYLAIKALGYELMLGDGYYKLYLGDEFISEDELHHLHILAIRIKKLNELEI